ncbi:Glycylpeptide N-tetradecanoyltransferase [Metarhizium acridum CQMa 102]|uniref:Glycylpeptide N-tetradecanoyltransferase n=2 Tax=Metarhizium acridum TaxID=92637 RepID=E9EFZ1_METAQ|nr:Glycylpeptide N-tetradecanoyltransferase [Metarhizium acridum CQMa 102]EFY85171.1 Glycylpeptide N-tetradecanoyltransferase [Metarhizium acridum CQMa 102]
MTKSLIRTASLAVLGPLALYTVFWSLAVIPFFQRHFLYAHKFNTLFWSDVNEPERWGFAKHQVAPFYLKTPDDNYLYAWHVLPLPLYHKHEDQIVQGASSETVPLDITSTESFRLLKSDPKAKLILYCVPSEEGLIQDAETLVNWAMNVAGIPSTRILLFGHSLGTAVTSGVAERFARKGVDFAGLVLVAGFSDLANLLTGYRISGVFPVMGPLAAWPSAVKYLQTYVVDKWHSADRLASIVRNTKRRLRLELIHAYSDWDIPWQHEDILFQAAANATTNGLNQTEFDQFKERHMELSPGGDGFSVTVKSNPDTVIRQQLVLHGGGPAILHNPPDTMLWLWHHVQRRTAPNMPPEESKMAEPIVDKGKQVDQGESESEDDEPAAATTGADTPAGTSTGSKKKKSKRKKAKQLLTGKSDEQKQADDVKKAIGGLTPQQMKELVSLNPGLMQELAAASGSSNPSPDQVASMLKNMNLADIMTGLAASGKNAKDMGAYKFWQTQPVPKFGEEGGKVEDGPLKIQKVEDIDKEPQPLVAGFEWVTVDLMDDGEMKEVYELLNGHYVEDDEAMFRFNYIPEVLRWAMMAPGWQRKYHIGVRASQSRKLVAFISAIPVHIRVRDKTFTSSEVNFLCVHKKLRGKRLAPVLIKEVTRVSNLDGVWQGLYTAGVVLPRPVSTCRYYHRALNWKKLHACGFSPLPAGSKPEYQVRKYALPETTATKGLREMQDEDVDAVVGLLKRYLARYDMAPEFTAEEARHWFLPKKDSKQVIWSYVVENNGKITDFFSFFCVESSIIKNNDVLRVAYLFYYASETGLSEPFDKPSLKTRLNALINDALILAKRAKLDVFNALSLMDNALFLEQQKFGGGDGQLHYYLFNYRASPISGGVDAKNQLDEDHLSGVGLVMP